MTQDNNSVGVLFLTCSSQNFSFFYLQLGSPFLSQSAFQSQLPELGAQVVILLILMGTIATLLEQSGSQDNVAFFPCKFDRSQTQLYQVAVCGCRVAWKKNKRRGGSYEYLQTHSIAISCSLKIKFGRKMLSLPHQKHVSTKFVFCSKMNKLFFSKTLL